MPSQDAGSTPATSTISEGKKLKKCHKVLF